MANFRYLSALIAIIMIGYSTSALSYYEYRKGRFGLGFTNQLMIDTPALSFRVLKSKHVGFQGIGALNTNDNGGYAIGAKMFNYIFDEPNMAFYSTAMAALVNDKEDGENNSGYQVDLGFGTEFSFPNLESVGFSFEFGFSFHKIEDDVTIQTNGNNVLTAGVHFYL